MTYRKVLGAVAALGFAVGAAFAQSPIVNPFSPALETRPESQSLSGASTQSSSFILNWGRPSETDTQSSSLLGSFNNANPSPPWTLSLSELSSGPENARLPQGLVVSTAPEPSTLALLGLGGLLLVQFISRSSKKFRGN